MQIGGYDLIFDVTRPTSAEEVFRAIKKVWPAVRFEDVEGKTGTLHVSKPDSKEFFLYRHLPAYRAVNKFGVEDYLANDFLHFILEDRNGQATMVVGGLTSEVDSMVARLEADCGWVRVARQAGAA